MRTLLKLGSLALTASLTLAYGCGGDDSDSGDSTSSGGSDAGGSGGSDAGGSGGTDAGGSGGSDAGGSGGSDAGGSGGTMAEGGSGGAPGPEAPYDNDDGLQGAVDSETGAFADDNTWHEGWTNFETDSSGVDCAGATALEASGDQTLTAADGPYLLEEVVHVHDGETMEIEAGTVICATADGSLVVSRGGTIMAEGTATDPIVFTSAADEGDKRRGDWGGVIILGNAENWAGSDVLIEGLNPLPENEYGGDDDADDSGVFAYVRIEFSGTDLGDGNEINGLTMGSVGSGTEIHHVQVNTTQDDCFEWFGGTVNASHLVCHNGGDDMFDADEGYRGTLEYLVGIAVTPVSGDPNGFEMDSDNGGAQPATNITINNVTLMGTGEEVLSGLTYGMVLRENLEGTFSNILISGFDAGVDVRDDAGSESDPKVTISDSWMFDNLVHTIAYDESDAGCDDMPTCDDDNGFDERVWFTDGDGNTAVEPE